jgi:hypothetical protein
MSLFHFDNSIYLQNIYISKSGIILCVEKEIIINREKNIYFREKNNLFSDKYFH